jgi:hypothetical protein
MQLTWSVICFLFEPVGFKRFRLEILPTPSSVPSSIVGHSNHKNVPPWFKCNSLGAKQLAGRISKRTSPTSSRFMLLFPAACNFETSFGFL